VRFLHTADWHIGKTLRGRSRLDEQERVLQEILDIALREGVNAMLIAGDLFDSHAPQPDAEKLVFWFLSELMAHKIPAVVIAGNHDHPRRFEALRPLLQRFHIHCCPHVAAPQQGGVFHLGQARVAVLPWMPEYRLMNSDLLMGAVAEMAASYSEKMAAMIAALTTDFAADTINLLVGHLYVEGAQASGSERAVHLTRPYALSAQCLPSTASYIALGHLHRPQEIAAPSPTYYSGSPLQLDFGEQGQQKRVVLIDAEPGRKARIDSVPLTSGRTLRSVKGSPVDLQLKAAEHNNGDWLHVTVEMEKFQPGMGEKIRDLLPDAIDVQVETPRAEAAAGARPGESGPARSPEELFRQFCRERSGEPSDELIEAFQKLYAAHQA
jgi:exonuclease SbcD